MPRQCQESYNTNKSNAERNQKYSQESKGEMWWKKWPTCTNPCTHWQDDQRKGIEINYQCRKNVNRLEEDITYSQEESPWVNHIS
eukprot:4997163-Ditylum_brightwellii.AAC.1